ncbi:MAG: hypothetical protein HKN47_15190, partial [Pirellulaceae bacterium]|nr:hypothetical protein [Pirellulaceae bacterium]
MRFLILAALAFQFGCWNHASADDKETQPETVTVIHYPNYVAAASYSKHLSRLLGPDAETVELLEQNIVLIRVPVDQQERVQKL